MYDDDVKKSWQVFARDVGRLARVRKASNIDVEHIVAEPEPAGKAAH